MTDDGAKLEGWFMGLERAEWSLWVKWALATAVGGIVGVFVGEAVGEVACAVVPATVGWAVVGTARR